MATSPYYTVQVKETKNIITNIVSSLHYEDCIKEDDLVELKLENCTVEMIDSNEFIVGHHILFSFGLGEQKQSGQRVAVIKDVDVDYANTITMTIKCRDEGFYMKKDTSGKVYKNQTSSQIVSTIASYYGMNATVDETTTVHESISQGNKTFHQFCKQLAKDEGSNGSDGTYEFYVRGNDLFFKKRDLKKDSKRTFTYGDGNGTVKYFNPSYKQENESKSGSVGVAGIDKETGEQFASKADNKTNNETALGSSTVSFAWKGTETGRSNKSALGDSDTAGKNLAVPVNNKAGADRITSGKQKDAAKNQLQMELGIDLDPTIQAGDIITVNGVARKHSGNWYVTKVTHKVDSSGGATTIEADKNGSNKSITSTKTPTNSANNTDVNKSQGSDAQQQTKKVRKFNWQGKEL